MSSDTRRILTAPSVAPMRTGRPRSASVEAAILGAALELLLEHGFEGMSMGQLAERARVGKAAIYRRWSSKLEVVIAALAQLTVPPQVLPDTGSVVGDLLELARLRLAASARSGSHLLFPRLVCELRSAPELRVPFQKHVVAPARAPVRAIVERGIARGELRGDLDPELVVDLLVGPSVYRLLLDDDLKRVGAHFQAVIAAVVEGIGR